MVKHVLGEKRSIRIFVLPIYAGCRFSYVFYARIAAAITSLDFIDEIGCWRRIIIFALLDLGADL